MWKVLDLPLNLAPSTSPPIYHIVQQTTILSIIVSTTRWSVRVRRPTVLKKTRVCKCKFLLFSGCSGGSPRHSRSHPPFLSCISRWNSYCSIANGPGGRCNTQRCGIALTLARSNCGWKFVHHGSLTQGNTFGN